MWKARSKLLNEDELKLSQRRDEQHLPISTVAKVAEPQVKWRKGTSASKSTFNAVQTAILEDGQSGFFRVPNRHRLRPQHQRTLELVPRYERGEDLLDPFVDVGSEVRPHLLDLLLLSRSLPRQL
jgi:hypothetical protein